MGEGGSGSRRAAKVRDALVIGAAAAAIGASGILSWLGTVPGSALSWLVMCYFVNIAHRGLQLLRCPELRSLEYPAADEASHVGGAALGLLIAAGVSAADRGQLDASDASGQWIIVAVIFSVLLVRYATRFWALEPYKCDLRETEHEACSWPLIATVGISSATTIPATVTCCLILGDQRLKHAHELRKAHARGHSQARKAVLAFCAIAGFCIVAIIVAFALPLFLFVFIVIITSTAADTSAYVQWGCWGLRIET
jgi:hypothetical protein